MHHRISISGSDRPSVCLSICPSARSSVGGLRVFFSIAEIEYNKHKNIGIEHNKHINIGKVEKWIPDCKQPANNLQITCNIPIGNKQSAIKSCKSHSAILSSNVLFVCYRQISVIANIENKEKPFKGLENGFCYWQISITGGSVTAGSNCI